MKTFLSSISFKCHLLAFILAPSFVLASGGDDHSHEKSPVATVGKSYFTVEASSEKHELLLRYKPIHPGEESVMELFVSDFLTNLPLDSITFQFSSPEDATIKFTYGRTGPGVYHLHGTFSEAKVYSIAVGFKSSLGPDLILLQNIEAGKELTGQTIGSGWEPSIGMVFGGGLLAGLLIMFAFVRLAGRRAKATVLLVLALVSTIGQAGFAHEGHGDAGNKGNNFSTSFEVPKDTQFLFEVATLPVAEGAFAQTTKLYGTVLPSTTGQALIQSPQTGRLTSVLVQVGQPVVRGQLLATVDPSLDPGSAVNYLSERNNVDAEYEAARQEYERLKSIEDIAAKRDISEATARYQRAAENKKLFERLANGQPDQQRSIMLRSPIDGVAGNFTLAMGATVNAGETLLTVTNLSKVFVEAQVFDKDAARVNAGVTFEVDCAGNDVHKTAQVKLIAPAQTINPSNQTQRVIFEMENRESEFKIGEFVNVRVFAARTTREISLPNSAISEINGRPVVFIKDAAEKFSVSYVSLGHNNGTHTVIKKGIEESERIATTSVYQLKMIYLNQ